MSPDAATEYARANDPHGAADVHAAESEPPGATYNVAACADAAAASTATTETISTATARSVAPMREGIDPPKGSRFA